MTRTPSETRIRSETRTRTRSRHGTARSRHGAVTARCGHGHDKVETRKRCKLGILNISGGQVLLYVGVKYFFTRGQFLLLIGSNFFRVSNYIMNIGVKYYFSQWSNFLSYKKTKFYVKELNYISFKYNQFKSILVEKAI